MFTGNGTISHFSTVPTKHGFTGKAFLDALPEKSKLHIPGVKSVLTPKQVHGVDFYEVDATTSPNGAPECDALLCSYNLAQPRGIAIAVYTADCVPILIVGAAHAAVIHAGWRGMAAGVIQSVLSEIRRREPESPLTALIGPCAQGNSYETGDEVIQALKPYVSYEHGAQEGKYLTDLPRTATNILRLYSPVHVLDCGVCTIQNPEWHSFRRDGARSGRNLSYIIV